MNAYLAAPLFPCWLAMIAGEFILALLLIFRRAYRTNSSFFTFAVFNLLRSLALLALALGSHVNWYFLLYWFAQPVEAVLLFGVVFGMLRELFQPYESLPSGLLPRFFTLCTIVVALVIACCLLLFSDSHYKIFAAMIAFQRGTAVAVVAVVVLITAVANVFAVPWRSRLAAMAWGLVAFLAGKSIIIHFAWLLPKADLTTKDTQLGVVLSVLLAEIFWIVGFARSEAPVPLLDQGTIEQLHRLLRLLRYRRQEIGSQVQDPPGLEVQCASTRSTTTRS